MREIQCPACKGSGTEIRMSETGVATDVCPICCGDGSHKVDMEGMLNINKAMAAERTVTDFLLYAKDDMPLSNFIGVLVFLSDKLNSLLDDLGGFDEEARQRIEEAKDMARKLRELKREERVGDAEIQ